MFEKLIPNAAACYANNMQQQSPLATQMGFAPDMTSEITAKEGNHAFCTLNVIGYIPVASTFSGLYRTLVGLAYLVKSVACFIFDAANREEHKEGMKIAAANIGRGLLEIVPVVGNLFAINIDVSRMMHRWSDASGKPYGDSKTIPVFRVIDSWGAIPVVGTVVNLTRVIFFTFHMLVNLPPAMSCNKKYWNAMGFSAKQIGIGILEAIPLIGTISYVARNCPLINFPTV